MIFWLFFHLFRIWFVSGSEEMYRNKQHNGLNDLVRDFSNIIQKPAAEYIDLNLDYEDAFDREATGVYKLIPYYMKIYPNDNHQDRFIIQQNPFNGEFQLVKIYNYIHRKSVCSLFHPNQEIQQKKDLTKINSFQKYQTNVKALADKNIKLEKRITLLVEEIEKMQEINNYLKENFQRKTKIIHEKIKTEKEIFEKKMKEKEFQIEEELIQFKLKNLENEQKIYDLQKTLETKEFLIHDQNSIIENLKLKSDFKYKEENLQGEILNLKNELKNKKENLKQEKEKNKESEKEKKIIMKKSLSQMSEVCNLAKQMEEIKKEMNEHKLSYQKLLTSFERHYYQFSTIIDGNFLSISQLDKKFRLKKFLCDLEFFKDDPSFDYERCLINFGTFMYVERIRTSGMIQIKKEKIFDPTKLALPLCTNYDISQTDIIQTLTTHPTKLPLLKPFCTNYDIQTNITQILTN